MSPGPVRRIRAHRGHFAMLAAVTMLAAALATAAPRITNDRTDAGLRRDVAALPELVREVAYQSTPTSLVGRADPDAGEVRLGAYLHRLPQPLPGLIGEAWYAAHIGPDGVVARGPTAPFNGLHPPQLGLWTHTGVAEAARLTAGAWPLTTPGDRPVVEAAVSGAVAETLHLAVGSEVVVARKAAGAPAPVRVRVVGIFEPLDRDAPIWSALPLALDAHFPLTDTDPYRAILLTDHAGLVAGDRVVGPATDTWRYRLDLRRLDATQLDPLITAVAAARHRPPEGLYVVASLDLSLRRLADRVAAAGALVAVVQTGILATLLGLLTLAVRLVVERRRVEFALLAARGAAAATIGLRTLVEAVIVCPAAAAAGWAVGTLVPGRAAPTGWLVAAVTAVAVLAVPLVAAASQRRPGAAGRRDVVRHRPSMRRLTAELSVLVAGGLGLLVLRRRGLGQAGVDPFLVAVPVLLAVAGAVLALRVFPWPVRAAGWLAIRSRGAVAFLGLSRAGRTAPATIWPLAVLVMAIATGVFCGTVAATIDDARDRATDADVGADAVMTGHAFAPETVRRLAAVPGVSAVGMAAVLGSGPLLPPDGGPDQRFPPVVVVLVDGPTWATALERSGGRLPAPEAWLSAAPRPGPLPAVVSPAAAEDAGGGGIIDVEGEHYAFRTAAVTAQFPGIDRGLARFAVLPWQALPGGVRSPAPNRLIIAGPRADPAALRDVGDAGQRAWLSRVLGRTVDRLPVPTEVTTWRAHRASLERTGANGVLAAVFVGGAAGGVVLALLTVGYAVAAGAHTRRSALSRLRTMGLSPRQGWGLLAYETAPLVAAGVLAGGAVGVALPSLFAPAFGLSAFTAGFAVRLRFDPVVIGGMLALVVVALAAAVAAEAMVNRRAHLGEVLRLAEEDQ
jgi:putative ABC transport system permease protein